MDRHVDVTTVSTLEHASLFDSSVGVQGWPPQTLQKYLFHVRQSCQPRTGRQAERLLLAYYQMQRRMAGRSSGRTTIRMLESLLRLAQVPPSN